mmetsp:Transcript_85050/g.214300  ORF Transcript_85050/g.214300 Transcript_85050/m.214300 type:complete len:462 (-) Transcript_85050:564-1949(-)
MSTVVFSSIIAGPEFREVFAGARPELMQEDVIPVCVPMYNEEAEELVLTLQSIYAMAERLPGGRRVKVCVILDGWAKISQTASAALGTMFPDAVEWRERANAAAASSPPERLTAIFQAPGSIDLGILATREVLGDSFGRLKNSLHGQLLDITVVLKVDNRKKHNSHDLFFRGFADHLNAKYAFATDCGTLFEPDCLRCILKKMDSDPTCVACTGRQRVMTKWQQPGCEAEGLAGWMLRTIQGYDYEASTVVFNGCFSLFGCLAVIPGPCGLFRLGPLLLQPGQDGISPFDHYARAAQQAEESQDMLDGNCILAEDRVLTYAALYLSEGGPWNVRWEKTAVFYFQSEQSLQTLVAQRRRWLNGTVAGYIYVLNQLGTRFRPGSGFNLRAYVSYCLILLMLLIYIGIALGPSLYIIGGSVSLKYLMWGSGPEAEEHRPFFHRHRGGLLRLVCCLHIEAPFRVL